MSQSSSASEIFHRAFYEAAKEKLGRWTPDPFTDDAVARLARKLHQDVNASLQEQRLRIIRPVPAPQLYFDFFKSRRPIAEAQEREGIFLLGVADALLTSVSSMIEELLTRQQVWAFLSIVEATKVEDRQRAREMLFDLVFLFVTNHEVGHFVHGHTSSESEEWAKLSSDPGKTLPKQAAEIEADGYSTFSTLNWLFGNRNPTGQAREVTGNIGAAFLRLYLIAALSYLEMGSSRIWNWQCPETFTHPQYLTRVDFLIGHVRGWCERHRPETLSELSHSHVQRALEAVHNCWHQDDSRDLRQQAEDLTSGPYASWEDRIREERSRLRVLLGPFQWMVQDYS